MTTATAATEQAPRIRIYRRDDQWVVDTGGRELPNYSILRDYLPREVRAGFSEYSGRTLNVHTMLNAGINPQTVADALRRYFIQFPNTSASPSTVATAEAFTDFEPAFLAAGSTVYRLVPVEAISASRALNAVRARVGAEGAAERDRIIGAARNEAQVIVGAAERGRAALREEREAFVRETRGRLTAHIPTWYYGTVIRSESAGIALRFHFPFLASMWRIGARIWHAPLDAQPVPIEAYIPVAADGQYGPEQAFAASSEIPRRNVLPHMSYNHSCVTFGEESTPLLSEAGLVQLARKFSRAFETVNLASLLIVGSDNWDKRIKPMIPEALREVLQLMTSRERAEDALMNIPADEEEVGGDGWNITTGRTS